MNDVISKYHTVKLLFQWLGTSYCRELCFRYWQENNWLCTVFLNRWNRMC